MWSGMGLSPLFGRDEVNERMKGLERLERMKGLGVWEGNWEGMKGNLDERMRSRPNYEGSRGVDERAQGVGEGVVR